MRYSLSIKYMAFSIFLISIITIVFTWIFVDKHKLILEEQQLQEAKIYIDILEASVIEEISPMKIDKIREGVFNLLQNNTIGYAYVMRNDGKIISDGAKVKSKTFEFPDDDFQEIALKATGKTFQENKKYLDISAPLIFGDEKLGIVRIGFLKTKLNEEIAYFTNMAFMLGLLFIVLVSFLTYLMIKQISKPLSRLTYLTSEISHGRFGETIDVKTRDEINMLAESFNRMSCQIEESNAALVHAKEDAEKFNAVKTEFLAHMSHEIRTPINTMLNYSSLAEEEFNFTIHPECKDYFKVMKNAGKRIIRTIDLILNMSEIEKGSYQPNFTKFDLVPVIDQLRMEFLQTANNKELDFSFNNEAKVTDVFADKYTITQIFQNIIDNAIKYTDRGFVRISLKNINSYLVTVVEDNGTGISEEFQKTMFEAFRQEEQGYTRKYDGAGLGLALVANYCELNKAEIKVESEKGKGTTFIISLKL